MKENVLILGIGNDILMDDGIGPRLVSDLEKKGSGTGIRYQTTTLGGLDILECIQGYEMVVFIDAIKTRGGVVGDVYEFSLEDFMETLHLSNLHDISFLTAIEMGRRMGMQVPPDIRIIAVEILEDQVFGDRFTPQLESRYPQIVSLVEGKIHRFMRHKPE